MKDFFKLIYEILTTKINIGGVSLPFNTIDLLIKFVLPIALALVVYKLLKRWTKISIEKSKLKDEKKEPVFERFRMVYRFLLLTFVLLLVISLFGTQINKYVLSLGSVLTHPIVEGISMVTILLIIPILYLGQIAGKISQKFAQRTLLSYVKLDLGTKQTLAAVAKNVTFILVLLLGLTVIGIDLTVLFGLFGVVGIGIGFGLQSAVANLFAGLIILTSKPVKVGDHILVDGTEGNLKEIRFLNSVVSTITHESIIIPNSKLIENSVHNFSFDDPSIIIKSKVQVSYNSDLDFVLETIKGVGERCPYILESKPVRTRVVSFDDSGITISLVCWINNSAFKYDASSWLNLEIWREFKNKEIEIPFPQVDLHVKRS